MGSGAGGKSAGIAAAVGGGVGDSVVGAALREDGEADAIDGAGGFGTMRGEHAVASKATTRNAASRDRMPLGRTREAGGGARPDYSPITAQRKPIMMKKPVNRAMRPRPP